MPQAQVLERLVLERLVEERLRQHEVDRFAVGPLSPESVEAQLEMLRSGFTDHLAMVQELRRYGLDEEGLRHQIRRQLRVVRYVEERLRPRIFVDLGDIEAYYAAELPDLLTVQGIALPPLDDVREEIRALLQERRLSEEIEVWTAELRAAADIVELSNSPERDLPPVLRRIGGH
jgi:glutamate/tyrosine decarboxylase-like PLP-dependent enzyme